MVLYLIRKLKMITIVSKKKCLIKLLIDILRQDRTLETFQYFNTLKIKNCSYKSLKNYILDKGFSFTYPVTPHHTISNFFAWWNAPEKCTFGKRFTLELVQCNGPFPWNCQGAVHKWRHPFIIDPSLLPALVTHLTK